MKRITFLLSSFLLVLMGCQKEETPYINVPDKIELIAEHNDIKFEVASNTEWKVTVSDHWFKMTPKTGNGSKTIRLVAEVNNTGDVRNSVLEFIAGSVVKRVPVSQPAFVVTGDIEVPESVEVRKGEVLSVPVKINAADWEYELTDGAWLAEAEKSDDKLVFNLNPAVAFDEDVPAVIEFTTPSDPAFYRKFEVYPKNYFRFDVQAEESFDLTTGEQFTIAVNSNIGWDYEIVNGAWLKESSRTDDRLVFDGNPDALVNPDAKARLTFFNTDYANFSYVLEIRPVAVVSEVKVNKAGCKVIKLAGDAGGDYTNPENLFNDGWLIYWGKYNEYAEGDPDRPNGVSYGAFQMSTSQDYKEETQRTFTIDAGKTCRLSKWITYHYYMYHMNDPISYEIYAYTADDMPSGEWNDSWVKIGSYDSTGLYFELAGLETGAYCPALADGDLITISNKDAVSARYYRFKMLKNGYNVYGWWNGAQGPDYANASWTARRHYFSLSEITLYEYE